MNRDERRINIRDLGRYVLRSWHLVVVISALLCILGITYSLYMRDSASETDLLSEDTSEMVSAYETAIDVIDEVAINYRDSLEREEDYRNNSILMRIDPYKVYTTTTIVAMKLDGELAVNNSTFSTLVRQYYYSIEDHEFLSRVATEMETSAQYLLELVRFEEKGNSIEFTNALGGRLSVNGGDTYYYMISVIWDSVEGSRHLMDSIIGQLQKTESSPHLIQKHSISIEPPVTYVGVDSKVLSEQIASKNRIYDYSDKIVKNVKNKESLSNYVPTNTSEEKQLSIKSILRSSGVAGLLLGIVLSCIVLMFKYLYGSVIRSEEDYYGRFVTTRLGTMESSNMEMIVADIVTFAQNYKNVALLSSTSNQQIKEYAREIKSRMESEIPGLVAAIYMDSANNVGFRKGIKESEAAILIEAIGVSNSKDIEETGKVLYNAKVSHVGSVLCQPIERR